MPPSKNRDDRRKQKTNTKSKVELKTIKKTPRLRNMKIPAEILDTPLSPGWTRTTPDLFVLRDSTLGVTPDLFENHRVTRRFKKPIITGRVSVIPQNSSPVITRSRRRASLYVSSAQGMKASTTGPETVKHSNAKSTIPEKIQSIDLKPRKSSKHEKVKKTKNSPKKVLKTSVVKNTLESTSGAKKNVKMAKQTVKNMQNKKVVGKTKQMDRKTRGNLRKTKKSPSWHMAVGKMITNVGSGEDDPSRCGGDSERLCHGSPFLVLKNIVANSTPSSKQNRNDRTGAQSPMSTRLGVLTPTENKVKLVGKTPSKRSLVIGNSKAVATASPGENNRNKHYQKAVHQHNRANPGSNQVDGTPEAMELPAGKGKVYNKATNVAQRAMNRLSGTPNRIISKPSPRSVVQSKENILNSGSVKSLRVKKASFLTPDTDDWRSPVAKCAKKKKPIKTPFKAAKILGKNESPTGNTPHKAARILGKLSDDVSMMREESELLTSTPLRSTHKRKSNEPIPVSEIGKRLLPLKQDESIFPEGTEIELSTLADVISNKAVDESMLQTESQANISGTNTETGWWGWICEIL